MGVVINDFEVLPAQAPAPRALAVGPPGEGNSREKLDPSAVAAAERALEARALRNWAH